MNKWILTKDGIKEEFLNFKDALNIFLNEIADHIWNNGCCNRKNENFWVYDECCDPLEVERYFHYKIDERIITDEEIAINERLAMALSYFLSRNANDIKENIFKTLKSSMNYQGEELDTRVSIKIDLKPEEVIADITSFDGLESYLRTNAFVMDDDSKTYYFRSKQYVVTAPDPEYLGQEISLDIKLEKIE